MYKRLYILYFIFFVISLFLPLYEEQYTFEEELIIVLPSSNGYVYICLFFISISLFSQSNKKMIISQNKADKYLGVLSDYLFSQLLSFLNQKKLA